MRLVKAILIIVVGLGLSIPFHELWHTFGYLEPTIRLALYWNHGDLVTMTTSGILRPGGQIFRSETWAYAVQCLFLIPWLVWATATVDNRA